MKNRPDPIALTRVLLGIGLLIALPTVRFLSHRETTVFGWGGLLDSLLLLVVASSFAPARSQLTRQLIRGSVTLFCLVVAWSQIGAPPWLSRETVTGYVHSSPFAWICGDWEGFVPLVEIFGGLAWLIELSAVLLWHRKLGKYLAVFLIVLQGLLTVFMPLEYSNWVLMVALLSFLPQEWMTRDRATWRAQWTSDKYAGRAGAFFFVMAVMLFSIFDRNIVWQFELKTKIQSRVVKESYDILAQPFVRIGNLILFNSIWKMYSPVWRKVVWIDWFYATADGSVVNWPQSNFSPEYRMHRRTWLQAIWTDFKKEKVFVGMLSGEVEKAAYGKYLCWDILTKTGIKPLSVHPEVNSFAIRGPQENWSIYNQAPENHEIGTEVSCD